MPPSVANRLADNWRPLLAIADCAGGEWPQKARAALGVEAAEASDSALAVMLLEDLRALFRAEGCSGLKEKLSSSFIVAELAKLKQRPWPEVSRGKPLTTYKLASMLAPFGIAPKNEEKGSFYYANRFTDAWARYLGPTLADEVSDRQEASSNNGLDVSATVSHPPAADGLSGAKEKLVKSMAPDTLTVRRAGARNGCAWTDHRSWIARIRGTKGHDDQVSILLALGEAAGADVSCVEESVALLLSPDLKPGIALNELRRIARDLHVEVNTGGRA